MLKRAWILSLCIPALLPAALLRIEVSERSDVLEGKAFASAGPYERIVGKAYFAVDPNLPANKIIADIATRKQGRRIRERSSSGVGWRRACSQ